ncbi:centrosomal protein of 131 kDa isoform X1 [Panthera tigris]|uniref:centrosomal protein of 131 kDa isoform X1 n=1 Tax=Panthera tigris TaxID=9694 RepID=UPI001C6FC52A|nr:centrosomal protein of 131 kDa isoform X1 [Panthera tigris]XP_042822059.1 centrosomal protein of 131 kDa isoform X1 [Panthera tigris]
MKGSRAASAPSGPPEGSPEGVNLSLTGLPPPVSWRPNSASAAKPIARSFSAVSGSEPRRKALEATGPGGSRTINNLRRSNSATHVHQPPAGQAWTGPLRPAEDPHFLTLFEGSPGGKKRLTGLSKAPSERGATWNVLCPRQDDHPRAFDPPPDSGSPGTLSAPVGPRRRECTVPLAPNFTANNRSNKGAVGNRVTTMLHNRYTPSEKAPPPKSSNHTAPSLNNILKAATGEGESGGSGKPHKNFSSSNHVAQNNAGATPGLLRRKEVTEEEAERFIHQVNRAAVTIQRWYRQQVQRRQARAACREHLLAPKREEQRQQLGDRNVPDLQQQKEAARRKVREEKARQARRLAVQELQQQKRAQKSGDPEPGLQKEARETEKPQPAQESALRPGSTARAHRTHKANNTSAGAGFRSAGAEDPCHPASNSSPEPRQFPENKPQDAGSQDVASEDVEVVGPAKGKAQSRATLDELLATLRLLEEVPEPLPNPRAYHKDKYSWTDEEDDASSLTADNLERFGRLGTCASPPEDGTLLSEAKLQSIMSFLHEMEKSGQDRPASAPQGLVPDEGRLEPTSTVSSSVMRLKLEVEEKKQAVGLLQKALVQQRDLTVRRVKETEKELGRQLRQQRDHYEATIQRHLSFIDQLIEDKKALAERCEAVVAELKQGDQRRRDREAQVQEQHELEIKKLKELMSATEKVRREKWINEKTRKIKEITVRGLEPEIQKLIAKHKQELKKLKGLHEAELLQADARAAQRYGRQVEELREHLEREKEALGQQERERAQQRFEQHVEQEQRALQQQRRRLYGEVAEEKERLGQQAARQRAELEELRQQLEESSAAEGRALRAEFEKGREEQERRHQMEMKALKDQLEVERQMWEASCAKKEEAWLLTRERELREEIRRGRDEEIELVIRRLEADMTRAREESERAAESRVRRIRDKYETELSELEQSERKLQERCAELKGRLGEAEGENLRLQGLVRQKERELADAAAVNEQLVGERSGLAEVLRQEFADRLAASEEETRQARAQLEQLTREKQAELEEGEGGPGKEGGGGARPPEAARGRREAGRPAGGAVGAAQAAVPERQVTESSPDRRGQQG